jgi:hypothetical protein
MHEQDHPPFQAVRSLAEDNHRSKSRWDQWRNCSAKPQSKSNKLFWFFKPLNSKVVCYTEINDGKKWCRALGMWLSVRACTEPWVPSPAPKIIKSAIES